MIDCTWWLLVCMGNILPRGLVSVLASRGTRAGMGGGARCVLVIMNTKLMPPYSPLPPSIFFPNLKSACIYGSLTPKCMWSLEKKYYDLQYLTENYDRKN